MGRSSSSLQRCFRALLVAVAAAGALVTTASPVSAATLTVNSLADTVADDGQCTLREAVENANDDAPTNADCASGSGLDTITFDSGLAGATIVLTSVGDTTWLDSALSVSTAIVIDAGGAPSLTITANNNKRHFYVSPSGDLSLIDVTITGGEAKGGDGGRLQSNGGGGGGAGMGGAVFNEGTLTIVNSTLVANRARGGTSDFGLGTPHVGGGPSGGGPGNPGGTGGFGSGGGGGTWSFNVPGKPGGTGGFGGGGGGGGGNGANPANSGGPGGAGGYGGSNGSPGSTNGGDGGNGAGFGGAIFNYGGTVDIENATLTGNIAAAGGNGALAEGGAVFNLNGNLSIDSSTLYQNTASSSGGAVKNISDGNGISDATIDNSILFGSVSANDFSGTPLTIASGSNNIIGVFDAWGGSSPLTADPLLGALAANGGNTNSFLPGSGSPAIDAGQTLLVTDQRGDARPSGPAPDIGSVEVLSPCTPTMTAANEAELALAIGCYNSALSGSTTTVNLTAPIVLTTLLPTITNASPAPVALLAINGNGFEVSGIFGADVFAITDGDVALSSIAITGAGDDGIQFSGDALSVIDSTFAQNAYGMWVQSGAGPVALVNTTLADNTRDGIFVSSGPGTIGLTNVTFADNPNALGGTGADRPVNTQNSIIVRSSGGSCPGFTAINDLGGNVVDDASCGSIPTSPGAGATLAAGLADNGCTAPCTQTVALLADSPAIDLAGVCGPNVDQRGIARPQGAACDSGAFERVPDGLTLVSPLCGVYDSSMSVDPILPGSGAPRVVQVTGSCGVPSDASAVVVTLTSTSPAGIGNLRVSESGVAPSGGVVTYVNNGLDQTNTVTVPLSPGGAIDIAAFNSDSHVRVAVTGYYSPAGVLRYNGVAPCAVSDSRAGQNPTGGFAGPFGAGGALPDVDVVGTFPSAQGGGNTDCGVPAGAVGVVVNIVSIGGTDNGGIAAGVGGSTPTEPTVNFAPIGLNNAAAAYLPVDVAGKIAVDVIGSGTTHVRLVVLGYLAPTGSSYTPVNPCNAFDSRSTLASDPDNVPTGLFAGKRVAGNASLPPTPVGTTTYNLTGAIPSAQGGTGDCSVPEGATAVLINLVAIQPEAVGNFRAFAPGTTPTGGVLNFSNLVPPVNNANAVVVPLDGSGNIDLFVNAPSLFGFPSVHARGVVLGYYN